MFVEDMQIGMKVAPISQTRMAHGMVIKVNPPERSVTWRRALASVPPQNFLYITKIDEAQARALCNVTNTLGGDYFQEFDIEPLP